MTTPVVVVVVRKKKEKKKTKQNKQNARHQTGTTPIQRKNAALHTHTHTHTQGQKSSFSKFYPLPLKKREDLGVMNVYCATVSPLFAAASSSFRSWWPPPPLRLGSGLSVRSFVFFSIFSDQKRIRSMCGAAMRNGRCGRTLGTKKKKNSTSAGSPF